MPTTVADGHNSCWIQTWFCKLKFLAPIVSCRSQCWLVPKTVGQTLEALLEKLPLVIIIIRHCSVSAVLEKLSPVTEHVWQKRNRRSECVCVWVWVCMGVCVCVRVRVCVCVCVLWHDQILQIQKLLGSLHLILCRFSHSLSLVVSPFHPLCHLILSVPCLEFLCFQQNVKCTHTHSIKQRFWSKCYSYWPFEAEVLIKMLLTVTDLLKQRFWSKCYLQLLTFWSRDFDQNVTYNYRPFEAEILIKMLQLQTFWSRGFDQNVTYSYRPFEAEVLIEMLPTVTGLMKQVLIKCYLQLQALWSRGFDQMLLTVTDLTNQRFWSNVTYSDRPYEAEVDQMLLTVTDLMKQRFWSKCYLQTLWNEFWLKCYLQLETLWSRGFDQMLQILWRRGFGPNVTSPHSAVIAVMGWNPVSRLGFFSPGRFLTQSWQCCGPSGKAGTTELSFTHFTEVSLRMLC